MKILALDSTENVSTAAITEDKKLLAQMTVNASLNHSETLLPAISELLRSVGITFDDIDMFACSEGPGSFTGVRIGAATVKGLAFGKNKPCVGVSALEAMAYNFVGIDGVVCPVMDARRAQLYNAVFNVNKEKIERLTPDRVIMASELAAELEKYHAPIYFCGAGYEIIRKETAENKYIKNTPELLKYESGCSVAFAAYDKYENAEDKTVFTDLSLSPTYLRPSQAERNRCGG